jgi:ankyrin repeat protein
MGLRAKNLGKISTHMSTDDQNKNPDEEKSPLGRAFDFVSGFLGGNSKKSSDAAQDPVKEFFRAIRANQLETVEDMLRQGFDPNTRDAEGITALHLAARNNYPHMIRLLINHKADPFLGTTEDPEQKPIDDAFDMGRAEALGCLVESSGGAEGMLHRACEDGDVRLVRALLSSGMDANETTENGTTPLLIALLNKHSDIADTLLDHPSVQRGMNSFFTQTDPEKRTAFQLATEIGTRRTVRKMLASGGNVNTPNAMGWTPLHNAINRGDLGLVKDLVEHGADINKASGDQLAPLLFACDVCGIDNNQNERRKIILYLIEMGANIEHRDQTTYQTALHLAAGAEGSTAALNAILSLPVDTEARDAEGLTPIFYAVGRDSTRAIELLVKHHANLNALDMQEAQTPLMHAVREGSAEDVRILLELGANPWLADASGKSALHYARKSDEKEKCALLEKALRGEMRVRQKPSSKPPGNTP